MLANRLGLKKKLQSALAFTLVLWCAGAGCALGTYAHTAMRNQGLLQAQAGGMALTGLSAGAGTHSCCKARHSSEHVVSASSHSHTSVAAELNEVALPESSSSSDATSCCPLTSGTFVVTARQSVRDDRASAALNSDAPVRALGYSYATRRALPLRLPNQNQTYLRGCAFLI